MAAQREGRHAGAKGYSWADGVAVLVLGFGLNLLIWGSFPLPGWLLVAVALIRLAGLGAYRRFDQARRAGYWLRHERGRDE